MWRNCDTRELKHCWSDGSNQIWGCCRVDGVGKGCCWLFWATVDVFTAAPGAGLQLVKSLLLHLGFLAIVGMMFGVVRLLLWANFEMVALLKVRIALWVKSNVKGINSLYEAAGWPVRLVLSASHGLKCYHSWSVRVACC